MRKLLVLGTIVALSFATAGQAARMVSVTIDGGTSVGDGLTAYIVSLDVDYVGADGYVNTLDLEFAGSYNQEWGDTVFFGTTFTDADPTPDQEQAAAKLSAARKAQDSHFLFDGDDQILPAGGHKATEGTSAPPPDQPLSGYFGWTGSTDPKPIAQIVTDDGPYDTSLVTGWVWIPFNDGTNAFEVWIPEPTTLGLLAVGVVGLIRRRK